MNLKKRFVVGMLVFAGFSRLVVAQTDGRAKAPVEAKGEIVPAVTDAERESLVVTAYDLDVHLTSATSGFAARAGLTVRNDGKAPLTRLVLQVSSSLRWESFSGGVGLGSLVFSEQKTDTDTDHTGAVSEAVVALPQPLAPGASYHVAAVYSGTIGHSSVRLDRIGAPADQAEGADWDAIAKENTALRGFGEVLWYPVAAAPAFLGDGARLFQSVARQKFLGKDATVKMRLAVEYVGEPPHSAYFCGRLERLTALSENANVPVGESPGVATAEFGETAVGFRALSLFVTDLPEMMEDGGLVSAVTEQKRAFESYDAAARLVQPLMEEWYGSAGPRETLRMIDHGGQAYGDGAFLVLPMKAENPEALAPGMSEALSHAWMPSRQPWIEDGLAQFSFLLWMERTAGRDAAMQRLEQDAAPLALAESLSADGADTGTGQSLIEARDEVYLRAKAGAVWWMLRSMVGDDQLKQVLRSLRQEAKGRPTPASAKEEAVRLQRMLEQRTGEKLAWFFDDWVFADKGLPDLSIVQVTPREVTAPGGGSRGWLVAVEVRNDGDAVAEVPVTVRSGVLTKTEKLRIAGKSSASTRIVFEKTPEEVLVNDGGVPEMRTSLHSRKITIEPR